MRKFGLIGFPLGHSFSQKYFTGKFEKERINDAVYENFPIENIGLILDIIDREPDLLGLNVTIPYKTAVLKYLDKVEPSIAQIGSVNVIKIERIQGKASLSGFNSDVKGITDSVVPEFKKGWKNALILGSGGSSGAVRFALEGLGLKVIVISRNPQPGQVSYIVNTTPLGMFPDIYTKPGINYDLLNSRHTLFDLVYNPGLTSFLKEGQERGCKIITGLKMLYSQAERSWEIWNDPSL
jgi:shikimate dehydrogenase